MLAPRRLILLLGLSLAACGGGGGGGDSCVANETQACSCSASEEGVQTCQEDGTFSACDCSTVDAGTEPETDAAPSDECSLGTDDCDENADCIDTSDGFDCECKDGYVGDGTTCDPDEASFVAEDLPATFAQLNIEGVGDGEGYVIGGLSRVGVEIEIVELPVSATQVQRSPGPDITYDDFTARDLDGDVESLEIWVNGVIAGTAEPRNAQLTFRGLNGERIDLLLVSLTPVSADTTITGGQLAEVRFTYDRFQFLALDANYIAPNPPPPAPTPGERVEITGVTLLSNAVVQAGDLKHPEAEEITPLFQWRNATTGKSGMDWMFDTLDVVQDNPANLERRAVDVYELDGEGSEVSRVQLYECWPYRLNVFNPTRPPGASYLLDLFVSFDIADSPGPG